VLFKKQLPTFELVPILFMTFFMNFSKNKLIVYSSLILIPILVYYKSFFYDFSPLDERWLILGGINTLESWHSLIDVFTSSIQNIFYRPIFTWSLIIDYHFGGVNPFAYHVSNVVFHIIAVILLYRFLILIQTNERIALVLSVLFSVHPVLVHAIAWVPGRNDSLLFIFTMASIIHFVKYNENNKPLDLILHFLFYALALFTKETAMLLPLVFVFLSFKYARINTKPYVIILFWFILLAIYLWMRSSVLNGFSISSADYITTCQKFLIGFFMNTGKAIFPFSQSVAPTISNSYTVVYFLITVLFFIGAYRLGVKNKFLAAFGLFTFCILLAPLAWYGAITPLGEQFEHRIYTPMIGLMIFVSQLNYNFKLRWVKIAALLLVVFFTLRTYTRMNVYKSPLVYLIEGVNDCPDNYYFQTQMGHVFYTLKKYQDALPFFNTAIARQPGKPQLYGKRGDVYLEMNRGAEAIADYTKAIELSPDNPEYYLARCMAYKKNKNITNAVKDMQYIQKNHPGLITSILELELNTALQVEKNNKFSELNALILARPDSAELYVFRAKGYFDRRMGNEALADLKKACELQPENKIFKGYYDKLNSTFPH
jgi:protein O-mannosyl-transferase